MSAITRLSLTLAEIAAVVALAASAGTSDAAIGALLLLALHRRAVLRQAFRPVPWRDGVRVGAVVAAGIWVLILLSGPLLDLLGWPRADYSAFTQRVRGNPTALFFLLLRVWTAVAFGEEVLARVFLIDRLEVLFGGRAGATPVAVAAAAALFGLTHAYQGAGGMMLAGAIGVAMGILYVRQQRRVWVNVAVHGAVDTVALLLAYGGVRFL